jgi:hypothetical protein
MNGSWIIPYGMALSLAAGLAACSGSGNAQAGTAPVAVEEWGAFELSVDSKRYTMSGDPAGGEGEDATASIMKNSTFSIVAGTYEVYGCTHNSECPPHYHRGQGTWVGPYPSTHGGAIDPAETKNAYKYPQLGLQPATLTITIIEDSTMGGAPSKRVKGTFKGDFATGQSNQNNQDFMRGPLRHIEGKFDLNCSSRASPPVGVVFACVSRHPHHVESNYARIVSGPRPTTGTTRFAPFGGIQPLRDDISFDVT